MARKKKEDLKTILQTGWGTAASIIAVAAACVGVGYYFGRKEVIKSYETTIEDMRFQQLQMQIDFQKTLAEEKMKLSQETVSISLEEYKQLLLTPVEAKDGKKK